MLEEGPTYGLHTHIVLHLPLELEAAFRSACTEALSGLVNAPLLYTDESKTMLLQVRGGQTTAAQWDRFRYMLKGIDPRVDCFGEAVSEPGHALFEVARIAYDFQGFIDVCRLGVAPDLGKDACARFVALVDVPSMHVTPWTPPKYNDAFLDWHRTHAGRLVAPARWPPA